jgi:hypothetical protein
MPAIHWDYNVMRSWYIKHAKYNDQDTKNDPVFAIVYESKRPRETKKNGIRLEPFVTDETKFLSISPVSNKSLSPYDLYVLCDKIDSKRKSLYLVYPREKPCLDGSKALFGDHFTFCLDASDKKKPCHFHTTFYTCDSVAGESMFYDGENRDYMPDKLTLPADEPNIFKKHSVAKETLMEFITFPWTQKTKPTNTTNGGAKRKNPVQAHRPISTTVFHEEFCDKWVNENVKSLRAIGIRRGRDVHWSVSIVPKGRRRIGLKYKGLHYITRVSDDFEAALWREFVQAL